MRILSGAPCEQCPGARDNKNICNLAFAQMSVRNGFWARYRWPIDFQNQANSTGGTVSIENRTYTIPCPKNNGILVIQVNEV
ncbi:MAG TPA: hypothetical protein VJC17_02370 [Candidatus Dojkabacteria bacterium]|nr:hypothetical protein [Candidatus Dojkabacteria bacterium]